MANSMVEGLSTTLLVIHFTKATMYMANAIVKEEKVIFIILLKVTIGCVMILPWSSKIFYAQDRI